MNHSVVTTPTTIHHNYNTNHTHHFYFRSLTKHLTRRQWKNLIQELLLTKLCPTSLEICCKIGKRNLIWEVEWSWMVRLSPIIFLTKIYTHGQLPKHTVFYRKLHFQGTFPNEGRVCTSSPARNGLFNKPTNVDCKNTVLLWKHTVFRRESKICPAKVDVWKGTPSNWAL